MFWAGTRPLVEHHQKSSPAAMANIGGIALMMYAAYRIKPTFAAVAGAVLLSAGYVNKYRREHGLPELPLPGVVFTGMNQPLH